MAEAKGWTRFCAAQVEWSLLSRDIEEARRPGGPDGHPYFPLASGLLTGRYRRGEPFPEGTRFAMMDYFAGVAAEQAFDKLERYEAYAADHDRFRARSKFGLARAFSLR